MIEVVVESNLKEVIDLLLTPEYERVMTKQRDDWDEPHGGRSGLSMMVKKRRREGRTNEEIFEEFEGQIVRYFPFVLEKRLFGLDGHPDIESLAAEEILLAILKDDGVPFIMDVPDHKTEMAKSLYEDIKRHDNLENPDWPTFYKSIRPRIAAIIGETCD